MPAFSVRPILIPSRGGFRRCGYSGNRVPPAPVERRIPTAILNGNVGVFNNLSLCHLRTINWTEILDGKDARPLYQYNATMSERRCECDESCDGRCWGPGPDNCQKFSKINCSPQCEQGRCFGPEPRQCCNLFCAGGCTGPKQSECLVSSFPFFRLFVPEPPLVACRNFYDDGECKEECPPMQRYNPTTYSWEPNPEGKYAYGATCVKKCPKHLFKDNGACVRSCPANKMLNFYGSSHILAKSSPHIRPSQSRALSIIRLSATIWPPFKMTVPQCPMTCSPTIAKLVSAKLRKGRRDIIASATTKC
ncbi:unnamed protein product [Notodromas monacha]|uniref:Furin-like cysteine-rich domain-containing protein n=1 Tax=Notodromas monacha TaxID=399045 RepID=A0A7R9GBU8_9CRUS|nr:unnamed protein product [Notodromas monacha]CAG0915352.1 unnamed protein product [Notodromas monacha]